MAPRTRASCLLLISFRSHVRFPLLRQPPIYKVPPPKSPIQHAALVVLGFVLGGIPGWIIRWHASWVYAVERELESKLHVSRAVSTAFCVGCLIFYYFAMIFAFSASFGWLRYRGKSKLEKKKSKERRHATEERKRLLEIKDPTKHHRAIKAYEKSLRRKVERKAD